MKKKNRNFYGTIKTISLICVEKISVQLVLQMQMHEHANTLKTVFGLQMHLYLTEILMISAILQDATHYKTTSSKLIFFGVLTKLLSKQINPPKTENALVSVCRHGEVMK